MLWGHILYKYKGSLNDTGLNIPAVTKIVNTGAFSKAREAQLLGQQKMIGIS